MTSYKCSKCDFTRSIKGYVSQHIKKTKSCEGASLIEDIISVCCEVCDKKFDNENLLGIHRKSCFEKKAIIKAEYQDAKGFNERLDKISIVIRTLIEQNDELHKEVRTLSKRIEKLEKTNKSGYEDYEDDNNCCDHEEIIYGDIGCREELFKGRVGWDEFDPRKKYQLKVSLNNEIKDGVVTSVAIIVDNIRYVFEETDKGKGDKLAKMLKTAETIYCSEKITCRNVKTSKCYCDDHKL